MEVVELESSQEEAARLGAENAMLRRRLAEMAETMKSIDGFRKAVMTMHRDMDQCLQRGLDGVIGDGQVDELAGVYQVHGQNPLLEAAPPSALLFVAEAAKHTRKSLMDLHRIPRTQLPLF